MKSNSENDKQSHEIYNIKEALIDLIYDIKSTQKGDVFIFNNLFLLQIEVLDEETIEEEKHYLLTNSPLKLIKELKNIIVHFYKSIKSLSKSHEEAPASHNDANEIDSEVNEYEKLLIICEAENRGHIAVSFYSLNI